MSPDHSLERTASGYAAWPFPGQPVHWPVQGQAALPVAARSAQTLGLTRADLTALPEHVREVPWRRRWLVLLG